MEQLTYLIGDFSNTKFINSFVKLINCEAEIISFNKSTKKDLRLVASNELVNQIAQFLVFYLKQPLKILSIPSNNQWHLNQVELINENEKYAIKNREINVHLTNALEDLKKRI